ncbi:SLC13 family permease [Candidatus Omnitrophota bacterium]
MESKFLPQKGIILTVATIIIAVLGARSGLNFSQDVALVAFSLSILGTLLFWQFRLSFAFLGASLVLLTHVTNLENFIRYSSMEIILFLIGMMIIVGFLKEIGVFSWLLQRALVMKEISAKKFMVSLVFSSALLACVIDEVSSILIVIMIIFEFCDYFEINPVPYVLAAVLATNIGSAGTVIGNPIGLMIAAKAGLTFEDFIKYSFPLMFFSLFILTGLLIVMFREHLKELDEKIKEFGPNEFLVRLLSVPPEKNVRIGFVIFGFTLGLIALHHRIELWLGLETNTMLLIAPMLSSAVIMVWRRHKARDYIEKDVEWWTLLFFMFLFAQAGVLAEQGVTEILAQKILVMVSHSRNLLITTILFGGALVSSALDNVVVVVGFIPILQSLEKMLHANGALWWALLFAACFGGNITVIGSTANFIALGTLERHKKVSISFWYWLKIGIVVGFFTLIFVWAALLLLPHYR